MKPNRQNIRKWVKALRSGDYKQGQGRLTTVHPDGSLTHCCLGVACVLSGVTAEKGALKVYYGDTLGEIQGAALPPETMKWLGLTDNMPSVTANGLSMQLHVLNDSGAADFSRLADLIEAEYLTA